MLKRKKASFWFFPLAQQSDLSQEEWEPYLPNRLTG